MQPRIEVVDVSTYEIFSWRLSGAHSFPRMFWPYRRSLHRENFGDALCYDLVLRRSSSVLETRKPPFFSERRFLFSIGSVLHFARRKDLIWGSGYHFDIDPAANQRIPFGINPIALRGHFTLEALETKISEGSTVLGDPGLLMPAGRQSGQVQKRTQFRVLPNHSHFADFKDAPGLLSPLLPWQRIATEIQETEHLISSSLHGVIFADSLGVPRTIFSFPGSTGLKFADYESAIDPSFRSKIYKDYSSARGASPNIPDQHRISAIKSNLEAAFPDDIRIRLPLEKR